ncbi:unnamed protein product [Trifolium pratense]|uniref:Uncharacterized protein n=1 Tax=Trifolium pratense TaxID=57577 RepID=A0ACB0ILQ2_TRIPR|nr:unnamed protein product [Trifolium pratense]
MGNALFCLASTCMVLDHGNANARNHPCHECPQSFRTEKRLKDHIKNNHKGTFKCNKCFRTFKLRDDKKAHEDKNECSKKK